LRSWGWVAGVTVSGLLIGAAVVPVTLGGMRGASAATADAAAPVSLAVTTIDDGGLRWPDGAIFTGSGGPAAADLASATLAFGDGSAQSLPVTAALAATHFYARPGTYTATLTVTDTLGAASAASATVTVGDQLLPVPPRRDYGQAVAANTVVRLSAAQLGVDPDYNRAALVTVTVTSPKNAGYLTVYADGTPRPGQSTVQFAAGQAASNIALATPGTSGLVDFFNGGSGPITLTVNTIAIEETSGVMAALLGDAYIPVAPGQVLASTKLAANQHATFPVTGRFAVPATATAVVLDVTASATAAAGHYVTYSDASADQIQQGAYWAKGQAATGLAIIAASGQVVVRNVSAGTASLTAAVVGYYTDQPPGASFLPSPRSRLLSVTLAGRHWVKLAVTGKNGIPPAGPGKTGTTAVAVNLTASGATAPGAITAYADGTARPATVTSLSYNAGVSAASAAIVAVGPGGAIDLYNSGLRPVTLAVDLTGSYYAYPPGS
jgi:PKD repeat protein